MVDDHPLHQQEAQGTQKRKGSKDLGWAGNTEGPDAGDTEHKPWGRVTFANCLLYSLGFPSSYSL